MGQRGLVIKSLQLIGKGSTVPLSHQSVGLSVKIPLPWNLNKFTYSYRVFSGKQSTVSEITGYFCKNILTVAISGDVLIGTLRSETRTTLKSNVDLLICRIANFFVVFITCQAMVALWS